MSFTEDLAARSWLCVAPAAACMLDSLLTFIGQPAGYWAGDYSKAWDGNPLVLAALEQHPAMAVLLGIVWLGIVYAAVLSLPRSWAKVISLWVTFCHAGAAATWMFAIAGSYFPAVIAFLGYAVLWLQTLAAAVAPRPRQS